jgi:hypothetical protein
MPIQLVTLTSLNAAVEFLVGLTSDISACRQLYKQVRDGGALMDEDNLYAVLFEIEQRGIAMALIKANVMSMISSMAFPITVRLPDELGR